jgi:general secretion pathway protein D
MRLRQQVPRCLEFGRLALWSIALACVVGAARVANAQDSSATRVTAQGILVDFQDVELRFVVSALAEAANLNVSYADLPARRITLRLRQPVPAAAVPGLLRGLAQSNGVHYTEQDGLIRLEPAAARTAEQPSTPDSSGEEVQLFVHRLKHARAVRMAATMQAIFGGASSPSTDAGGLSQRPLSERLREQAVPPMADSARPQTLVDSRRGNGEPALQARLRGEVQIVPDETTNSLLVRAMPSDWRTIRAAIDAMDLRPLQVLIEVVIAEVRTSDDRQLGVSATVQNGSTTTGTSVGGELKSTVADNFVLTLTRQSGDFSADIALAALAARGNVRILSRPLLLAQNNQESRILVGEQRPFVQVFRSLPTENAIRDQVVQYRDVATTLTLRPTINPDGYVNLQVLQEVSTATEATQFGAPIISTREASSFLFVRDGQTAVLGGLVSRQTDRVRSGIPYLSRLPLIGALFGSTTDRETTSELFLFLTPHVIQSDEDANRLRDELQRQGSDSTGLKMDERSIRRPRTPR